MGLVVFLLACSVASSRLLLLWWKTREKPELYLGLGLLTAGTFGWAVLMTGYALTPPGHAVPEKFGAIQTLFNNIGTAFFYLFVRRTFRPHSRWATLVTVLAIAAMTVSFIYDTVITGVTYSIPITPTVWLGVAGRGGAHVWSVVEAGLTYRAFQKRARIGLGDPVVANRIFLWGMSSLVATVLTVIAAVFGYALMPDLEAAAKFGREMENVYGALAATGAVCLWLAFLPPKAYLRWLTRESVQHG